MLTKNDDFLCAYVKFNNYCVYFKKFILVIKFQLWNIVFALNMLDMCWLVCQCTVLTQWQCKHSSHFTGLVTSHQHALTCTTLIEVKGYSQGPNSHN